MDMPFRRPTLLFVACSVLACGTQAKEASRPITTKIAGRCLDADRDPIHNKATVRLYLQDYGWSSLKPIAKSRTDSKGRFAFEGIPAIPEADWGMRYYFVLAEAADYAFGVASIRNTDVPAAALEIVMLEPASAKGQITDNKGKPVKDAVVGVMGLTTRGVRETLPIYNNFHPSEFVPTLSTKTDASGRFDLKNMPPGAALVLRIVHPLYVAKQVQVSAPVSQEIELEPGGIVTGRVVYAGGRPAANIVVQAQGTKLHGWSSVKTDAKGRYRLESLKEDAYNIWAKVDGWTVKAHDSFAVAAGKTKQAPDLVFVRGGFIIGKIVDADGKAVQPGKGSNVGLYGPSRPRSGVAIESGRIQADGTFRIRAAPGKNYVYLRSGWIGGGAHNVTVEEGKTIEVEFVVAKRGK